MENERKTDTTEQNAGPSAQVSGSALWPCPFCGGDAESDMYRGFIDYKGVPGNATAIYCMGCNADMTMCHGDFPEYAPEDLLIILRDAWNRRAPNDAAQ